MQSDSFNVGEYLLCGKPDDDRALLTLDGDCTYGDLRNASAALAGYLCDRGVNKGDRVLLIGENSFFWAAGYLALLRAGFVCVPVPPSAPLPTIQFFTEYTDARFALVQSSLLFKVGNAFSLENIIVDRKSDSAPAVMSLSALLTKRDLSAQPAISTRSSDLAALMLTSGSTRQPQAVIISHGNIRANTESIIEYMGLTSSDRIMVVLPFHYCYGTSLLHTHLRVGGTMVLDSRFMYPEKILQRMRETQCTGFAGVPSHYRILLNKTSLNKRSFPSLRYVQQAGGPLEPCTIQRLRKALPTTRVFVMYGQTEATARLSFLPPELLDTKMGSIGKGIPGVKLSVENEGGPVRPGEIGEIIAEGENVGQGYWRNLEETARTFQNGRLHTGDMATVDEDGFITIVSRARDFLKCGGTRISCQELEQKILEYGDLQEVAVIGIPDSMSGEAVKAFVVPRANAKTTPEQVRLLCKTRLPFQLVPREVVVLETLPKNDSGKVLKEQLRSLGD